MFAHQIEKTILIHITHTHSLFSHTHTLLENPKKSLDWSQLAIETISQNSANEKNPSYYLTYVKVKVVIFTVCWNATLEQRDHLVSCRLAKILCN